jgi:hypothetical protein
MEQQKNPPLPRTCKIFENWDLMFVRYVLGDWVVLYHARVEFRNKM